MNANRSQHTSDDKRGLSFAFPMRLPDGGIGAGNPSAKPANKSWAKAKASLQQNLPRR